MTFERVRVGDVLHLERREVTVEPSVEYEEIGVRSFGRGIFHKEPVDGASLGNKRVFWIEPGDLVISNVFGWEGAIAVASEAEAGRIGSHRFMTFVPHDGRIDVGWARWFLLSEFGLDLIQKASPGSAGRNKTLAVKRFEDLVIPLPPIDEQRRTAARLNAIRDAADRIVALSAHGEVVRGAFAPSVTAGPHLTEEAKLAHGWRWVTLRSVMTQSADRVTVEPGICYSNVGIYSFGRGVFEKLPIEGDQTSATTLLRIRRGQFIYSRLFAFEGAYATVPDEFDGYFVSNEFPSFDTDGEQLKAEWLTGYLSSPGRWAELATSSVGLGVRRQRVPVDALLDHRLLLPPVDQQRRAIAHISMVNEIAKQSARAVECAKALVPAALNKEFETLGA